jgi:type IV pilus biogenesis protein CpaD/CtpE
MHHSAWLIIAMLVAGCTPDTLDPSQRAGTWMPAGDNDANLRAMVANPHDLVEGAGQGASAGAEAAPPVARVLAGKRYPLPSLNASTIGGSSQPPQQQGSANPDSAQ